LLTKSAKVVVALRRELDSVIGDYDLLKDDNNILLAEHNVLWDHVTSLVSELAKAKASTAVGIAALKVNVVSIKAHILDDAAAVKKHLVDFEMNLTKDLANLSEAYERNIQSINNLCSPILNDGPSVGDYMRWLAVEIASLPEVFSGINENFISVAVEGVLVMASDPVDLAALQASIADSGADIIPGGRDVQKTALLQNASIVMGGGGGGCPTLATNIL
jgi:hypothetical protein